MEASVFARSVEYLRMLAIDSPQSKHGWAAEVLKQLGERSPEELKRLQARMPFIQTILSAREITITPADLLAFLTDLGDLPQPTKIVPFKKNWLDKLVKTEINAWQTSYGWKVDADRFAETLKILGKDRLEILMSPDYDMETGMMPDKVLTEDMDIPRWTKPRSWVWEQYKAGNFKTMINGELVKLTEVKLCGRPVLFDRRCKPNYDDGRQRWDNDRLLEYIIGKLQQEGQLPIFDWCERGSRFGLNKLDWLKVASQLDKELQLPLGTFRLERWEEWSLLSQYKRGLPRFQDSQTNTWVWFDQYFKDESNSLDGGGSGHGGFASVYYGPSDEGWFSRSARLLGDLGSLVS